jgi:cobalt-zinc-cadmium efflux system membrane fusion protein
MTHSTVTRSDLVGALPAQPAEVSPIAPQKRSGFWRGLLNAVPTATVVSLLAGLAFWGHSTDWTLPKFSAIVGKEVTEADDWCKEHNVPESHDIECHPDLLPPIKDYGWCKEHGVAQCPLHHPDVAQLRTVPVISAEDFERANRALALMPRAENNSLCKLHTKRIQFASITAVEKVGLDIEVAKVRPVIEAVAANAEVVYDETHSAHLASRVAGTVCRVERQVGDQVGRGDVLALIDAAEVGRAKAEFLQAISQLRLKRTVVERLKPLADKGAISGRQLIESESALQEAQIRLLGAQQALVNLGLPVSSDDFARLSPEQIAEQIQYLGLPSAVVKSFDDESTTTSNLFPVRAPLAGVVVDRKVVAGEVVEAGRSIFGVADVRRMWLMLDVRQEYAKYVSLGQPVLFRPSDSDDEPEVRGHVSWISTAVDDQTRTVKVRVDLPNPDGRLRANTFGTGRIVLREEQRAVVIPSEAVHWDGDCHVVFVRDKDFLKEGAPKFFHVRKVRLGVKNTDATEIIVGLLPGEVIASKNSVVLEAQLLKSNLGAGCGCADGH